MSDLQQNIQPNLPMQQHCQAIEAYWALQQSSDTNNIPMKAALNLQAFLAHLDGKSLISAREAVKMDPNHNNNFYAHFGRQGHPQSGR